MEFWNFELNKFEIYKIDYDKLTLNPEHEIKEMLNYLQLDWESVCLNLILYRAVSTASDLQIRKKIYSGSSNEWLKYLPYLKGVFDNLD